MTRYLLFACLLLTSCLAVAQVQWVPFAGVQSTSTHYLVRDSKQEATAKTGVMAGLGLKVPFDNQLFFFPSVYYSLKGYKVALKDSSFPPSPLAVNNNTTIHTIEICPMFQVDFNKKPRHMFVRFGPAVDIAISGKETFDTVSADRRGNVSRPMTFAYTEYGRFSASANLHLGYESARGWLLYAYYNHGIGSMNNADRGPKIFHRIYGISFGWLLGHNPLILDTRVIDK